MILLKLPKVNIYLQTFKFRSELYNLNKINIVKREIKKYEKECNYGYIECPCCGSDKLISYGGYERNVVVYNTYTKIKIKRVMCKECGKTHSLIPYFLIPYYQYEKIEGVERRTIEKIPEKAYREAIANALVHRAWDVKASIKVSMFEDRIEISSPGGLPAELSADEYVNGQVSILRNPIIGNVFFRLKYIEKFGTGILRINHLYRNSIKKPDYKVFENSIKVVLPVMEELGKFTEMEAVVWRQMQGQKEMTRVQIERNTGIKKDTLLRILNGMIEKGFIQKTGAGRGTKYSTDN